eukprot:TRINITY_DN12463_c3_g1_i7.p1 TRINITY_DN12463_c3_g1~~TRINITY_DN12463_c3_g1_i7.p1  ORF type:complete len:543 (+),score=96.31 TRINITY_DN12463_c3_g1_i7:273-1901(+)
MALRTPLLWMYGLACFIAAVSCTGPNIVFILADDLGYNELGYINETRGIQTPNIDQLANNGVKLTNYYVNPICSPTRSALHTGRYTHRLGTQSNVIYWDTPWGISLSETFLPELMQEANYSTAMFGKWHLGMLNSSYTPLGRGYQTHHGYYQGCESAYTHVAACCSADAELDPMQKKYVCPSSKGKDYRGYDWWSNGHANITTNETKSVYLIRDLAVNYVQERQNSGKPFYMYLPFQNIHAPYECDHKYYNMYPSDKFTDQERVLFGYISELDDAIGHVVQALRNTGQFDNTIIIFSSDNGAPGYPGQAIDQNYTRRNYPFRGVKTEIWEGGTHVPGFVSSPLLPQAVQGTSYHGLMHITDWLPTIAQGIAGGRAPQDLDGHDQWTAIVNNQASPRVEMVYGISPICHKKGGPNGVTAQASLPSAGIRMNEWKLLAYCVQIEGVFNGSAYMQETAIVNKSGEAWFANGPALFNLNDDPSETRNVAADNPEVVQELTQRLLLQASRSVNPMVWVPPYQGPNYFCANCSLHPTTGPYKPWGPWL